MFTPLAPPNARPRHRPRWFGHNAHVEPLHVIKSRSGSFADISAARPRGCIHPIQTELAAEAHAREFAAGCPHSRAALSAVVALALAAMLVPPPAWAAARAG